MSSGLQRLFAAGSVLVGGVSVPVVAVGVTAVPMSEWLSRHIGGAAPDGPEIGEAFDHPIRRPASRHSPG